MAEQCNPESWLARVEIRDAVNGKAQVYINGKLVPGVIGYKIEQNSQDKRVPILELQVQCSFDMESGAIPLLPEPWTWFYKPVCDDLVDVRDIPQRKS